MELKGFGKLLDESFTAYKEHFGLFMRVSFLIYFIPTVVISTLYLLFLKMPSFWTQRLFDTLTTVFLGILNILLTLTVIKVLLLKRTKKELRTGEAIKEGARHFMDGLFLSVVMTFALIGLFALFIVPGIIFSVYWAFVYYALVTDSKKIMGSFDHSKSVIQGRWWTVLLYMFLESLFILAISIVMLLPLFTVTGLFLMLTKNLVISQVLIIITGTLIEMITVPFSLVFMEKFYLDLKETMKHS